MFWHSLKAICHRLKSAARTVGALELGDLCERIERLDCDEEISKLMPDLDLAKAHVFSEFSNKVGAVT